MKYFKPTSLFGWANHILQLCCKELLATKSQCFTFEGPVAFRVKWPMERPLVIGSASGVFSSLALAALRDLASGSDSRFVEPLTRCLECTNWPEEPWVKTFTLGVLTGVLVWPLVDILWLLRERWRRFVWRQISGTTTTVSSRCKSVA